MNENEFVPIEKDEAFQFCCHHAVPCFNHCCRDLNQALSPYDVVMLRTHLELSWSAFKDTYAAVHTGPATGLPVVSLRFEQTQDRSCPFVTKSGCRVYASRPASCRLYPLARALHRSPESGRITEHFALLCESHCRGFEQGPSVTVRQWIADQQLAGYFIGNDALFELIAFKNKMGKGPLPPSRQKTALIALYDLDTLKAKASTVQLEGVDSPQVPPLPNTDDDIQWLTWSMSWIKTVLAG